MASTEPMLGDSPSSEAISQDESISGQDREIQQSGEIQEAIHAEREQAAAATEEPLIVLPDREVSTATEDPLTAHPKREFSTATEGPLTVHPESEPSTATDDPLTIHPEREFSTATEGPSTVRPEKELSAVTERSQEDQTQGIATVNKKDDRPVVLVTNDDGIQAPGIRALVEALLEGGRCEVYVCAPDSEKSGVAHSITTRETLAVSSVDIEGVTAYELSGTPADCVSLGLSDILFSSRKPSLVLSGVNKGCNCGYHIFYSGTVAAAREAFICGVPSMALSLNWKRGQSNEKDFKIAARICLPLVHAALHDIEKGVFPKGFFLNIDVPTEPAQNQGFRVTKQGTMRAVPKWRIASSHRGMFKAGLFKENAIGARLAQLGVAASAVGAARHLNSTRKNTEIESVAGPENGSQSSNIDKKQYYKSEILEIEPGELNTDNDFGALQAGFVTVTPLGLLTHLETDSYSRAADWIASSVEIIAPSAL